MSVKSIYALVATGFIVVLAIIFGIAGFQTVDDSEIVVYQSWSGNKEVYFEPGVKFVLFGKTTIYQKSDEFYFGADKNGSENPDDKKTDLANCFHTRFNDQGAAHICGQVSFKLPRNEKEMLAIHSEYHSMEGIKDRIIKPTLANAIYYSGPLMSSKESAGPKRSQFSEFINEQAMRGIYKTVQTKGQIEDFTSPPVKTVELTTEPVKDEEGNVKVDEKGNPVLREVPKEVLKPKMKNILILEPDTENGKIIFQSKAITSTFNIQLSPITVSRVVYEKSAKDQIDRQRDLEMQIQTKIAEAEKAKQEAVTSEETGKAAAAKARWEQEVKKAQALTEAQQQREVAEEDLKTAKLEREAKLERAKGEAEAKKLVMLADGALDKKLDAYVKVNKAFAAEIGKQRWVPEVSLGNGSSSGASAAANLMQLWQVKAARDLNLDLGVK